MSSATAGQLYDSRLVAVTLAVALLATADCAAHTYGGSPWGMSALVASVTALVAWAVTTLRRPRGAPAAFALYIGALAAMMLFEAEEWRGRMPSHLVTLFPAAFPAGVGITEHAFIAVFPLTFSALLLLGALTYYHGSTFGRFCAWLTFAWGLTASLSVYVYASVSDLPFHYIGGMITAPVLFLVSLAGVIRIVRSEGANA